MKTINVSSSALPTGAATSALQGGGLPAALGAGGGLKIDGSGTALPVSGTFYQATQPVSIASMPSTPVTGTFYQATQPVSAAALPLPSGAATSALQGGGLPAALGAGGGLKVDGSGTALPVSLASVPSHAVTNAGTFAVQNGAATAGGATMWKSIDVDETEDEVKGSAGQIYMIHAMNMKASVLYLKVYNNTAAGVTVGTTVPDWTFPVPTLATTNGAGFVVSFPTGIECGTGITIACTTGLADNDSGAPGANEMIVNIAYK